MTFIFPKNKKNKAKKKNSKAKNKKNISLTFQVLFLPLQRF